MNNKFFYLDKRDEYGTLLNYSSRKMSFKMSKYILKKIKKTTTYSEIISLLPEKYIELFFVKYLFFELKFSYDKYTAFILYIFTKPNS